MERPNASEYAPFYAGYVSLVPETDVISVLEGQSRELRDLANSVPADRERFRYAPDKWSVRELFGHVGDGERVFGYRAFCISRGDQASLPGFDEKEYMVRSGFDGSPLKELAEEFALLRRANLAVLRRLDEAAWKQTGTANETRVSVRALAYVMAGHVRHHLAVLLSRYGVGPA